jgi:regulatory protein
VSSRLKRPFGLRRIKQELLQKGLDKEIIETAFAWAKEDYQEEDVVRKLAEQKFAKSKGIDPVKAKQRIYAYLMRRGFSPDLVSNIVIKLVNEK